MGSKSPAIIWMMEESENTHQFSKFVLYRKIFEVPGSIPLIDHYSKPF